MDSAQDPSKYALRCTLVYITNLNLESSSSIVSIFKANFREPLASPSKYSIDYFAHDGAGFLGGPTTAIYLLCSDLVDMSHTNINGDKTSRAIMAFGSQQTQFTETYLPDYVPVPIDVDTSVGLQSIKFWFTDLAGNHVRFDINRLMCVQVRLWHS